MKSTLPDARPYPANWRATVISCGLALALLALGNGLASRSGPTAGSIWSTASGCN